MSAEKNQLILNKIIEHIDDVNSLISKEKRTLSAEIILSLMQSEEFSLTTTEMNLYLVSLLKCYMAGRESLIQVSRGNELQLLIINFVNSVLEELNIKKLGYEVY